MKFMSQTQNIIIVGVQAAALHSTYTKSATTEVYNTNVHTRFKPVSF
jgi:hypothetical protein